MARSNVSALQRIQVGVLGLLAVLLFVYIANLILERVPSRNTSTAVEGAPAAGGVCAATGVLGCGQPGKAIPTKAPAVTRPSP